MRRLGAGPVGFASAHRKGMAVAVALTSAMLLALGGFMELLMLGTGTLAWAVFGALAVFGVVGGASFGFDALGEDEDGVVAGAVAGVVTVVVIVVVAGDWTRLAVTLLAGVSPLT